jgi:hypothetical protein
MWLLFHASMALAAPVGEPVPHPDQGTMSVRVLADLEEARTLDKDCGTFDPCEASWSTQMTGVEFQWSPRTGFGLSAELGYQSARLPEANFRGSGPSYALSLRGAMPMTERWWLAGQARWAGSQLKGGGSSDGTQEASSQGVASLSALIAWTELDQGPSFWGGAQSSLLWRQTVYPLGKEDELVIPLRTQGIPLTAVGGLSLRSGGLGLPWENSIQISVGLEGRIGQTSGLGTWLRLTW